MADPARGGCDTTVPVPPVPPVPPAGTGTAIRDLSVTPLLFIARALVLALRGMPDANASWDEYAQEIVLKHYVNLGVAAATERGPLSFDHRLVDGQQGSQFLADMAAVLNELGPALL